MDSRQRLLPRSPLVAAALLVAVTLLAYANSFDAPFQLDDAAAVTANPSIRQLTDLRAVLHPPRHVTTAGRPLLNLTFAENWALSGTAVRSYHVVNFAIHAANALLLFGLTRRLWRRGQGETPAAHKASVDDAFRTGIAFLVALLWAVHPLTTESVTYISQRAEALMALCYLGTLYTFTRGITSPRGARWRALAVVFCALGMAVKEPMVTAPVAVLLFDRSFFAQSWWEVLRRRWRWHAALAATWIVLVLLMRESHVNTWENSIWQTDSVTYAATEAVVVLKYLGLAAWPCPLVFDYGTGVYPTSLVAAAPAVGVVVLLLGGAVWLWRRAPRAGFLALVFFIVLAPTSSVVPIATQPMAESRMYLPLAAFCAAVVLGLTAWVGRRAVVIVTAGAVVFAGLTLARNRDYRSPLALWTDSVAKFPGNARARSNLGLSLADEGRTTEALAEFEAAIEMTPRAPQPHYNLANILAKTPATWSRAAEEYEKAIRLSRDYLEAYRNYGLMLRNIPGRAADAVPHLEMAARLAPNSAEDHSNLATAYATVGRLDDALREYQRAVALEPDKAALHFNYGNGLLAAAQFLPAIAEYRRALELQPDYFEARNNLGAALLHAGDKPGAIREFEAAVRLRPDHAPTQDVIRQLKATP